MLPSILSDIYFDILFDICSVILSGISSENFGNSLWRDPAWNALIRSWSFGGGLAVDPEQAGAGPLSALASGGGVLDNFRSSARRPELGDKPSPVPGVDT